MFKKFLVVQIVLAMTAAAAFANGELAVLKAGGPTALAALETVGARTAIARVVKLPEAEIARMTPKAALEAIRTQIASLEAKGQAKEIEAQLSKVFAQNNIQLGNSVVAQSNTSGFTGKSQSLKAGNGAAKLSSKTTSAMNANGNNFSAVVGDLVKGLPSQLGGDVAAIAASPLGKHVISAQLSETCRNSKIVGAAAESLAAQLISVANEVAMVPAGSNELAYANARTKGMLKQFVADKYAKDCNGAIRATGILAEKNLANGEAGICPTIPAVNLDRARIDMSTCTLN